MKKNKAIIILSYGTFLGWLLSFPYNGPVLEAISALKNLNTALIGLVYIVVPALFLVFFLFAAQKEKYAKPLMLYSVLVCIVGSSIIYFIDGVSLYFCMAIMGISSVIFILGWSYFYTIGVTMADKMRVMALVIITGNIIYYAVNVLSTLLSASLLLAIATLPLFLSLWLTARLSNSLETNAYYLHYPLLPRALLAIVCVSFIVININGGLMFQGVYPYLKRHSVFSEYYTMVPYIVTLAMFYFLGRSVSKTVPVYLSLSLLGLAYTVFAMLGPTAKGYFLTETLAQAGWALIDLFLWTLLGEIATLYGQPLKICALGLSSNLFAVFLGGLIGMRFLHFGKESSLIIGMFASAIMFVAFSIVPWLSKYIEKDVSSKVKESARSTIQSLGSLVANLPRANMLTPRELEVTALLLDGNTNKEIANKLVISENTVKIHARHIYSKIGVENKKELLHTALLLDRG